jgi:recombination endonuclease VII
MSLRLRDKLPADLLQKAPKAFDKLDHQIKELVVRLAEEQGFKCFFCETRAGLFIEHEHCPGVREKLTIYNIRGLVCSRCNQHISYLEQEQLLGFKNFENAESWISSDEFEGYTYLFDQRIVEFQEAELLRQMGASQYWERFVRLSKIEWRSKSRPEYFQEAKFRQRMKHPHLVIKFVAAALRYVQNQFDSNPQYDPPDAVITFLVRVKPLVDKVRASLAPSTAEVPKAAHCPNAATGNS